MLTSPAKIPHAREIGTDSTDTDNWRDMMADILKRTEGKPDDIRIELGRWSGSVTRYSSGNISGELGTGYGDVIGIETIADCDAIIALATALKSEWIRLETGLTPPD